MTVMKAGLLISADSDQAQAEIARLEAEIAKISGTATTATGQLTGVTAELQTARNRLLSQFDPLIAAQLRHNQIVEEAVRLAQGGALSAQELAKVNAGATAELQRATAAAAQHANGLQNVRIGMQQLGFQAGDFTTQVAMGQNALVAFAVQSQQAVGALQLMAGAGDQAKGKLGQFATFMAGPWGIALGIALPIIGILGSKLLEAGDASDTAKAATINFTDTLVARTGAVDNFRAAVDQLNGSTRSLINTQALMIDSTLQYAQASIANIDQQIAQQERALKQTQASAPGAVENFFFGGGIANRRQQDAIRATIGELQTAKRGFEQSAQEARVALERRTAIEAADPIAGQRAEIQRAKEKLERDRFDTLRRMSGAIDPLSGNGQNLSAAEFQRQYAELERQEAQLNSRRDKPNSSSNRSTEAAARAVVRLNQQAENYAERTADAIAKINDQWTEQPSRIQQANDATRKLNAIIREAQDKLEGKGLGEEQIAELQGAITGAQAALAAVSQGIQKPFRDMVEQSERQRDIQLLILQGREREAEVLARTQQLSDQIGTVTSAQRAEIERIVAEEERLNELLARREDILGIYNQAIGGLRSSLEELLSGGSAGNFFKSIRQNARQLQGQLLTEQLFGGSLRDIEKKLRQQTGMEGAVEVLERQTRGAGDQMQSAGSAAASLASSLNAAAAQIRSANARISSAAAIHTGIATGSMGSASGLGIRNVGAGIRASAAIHTGVATGSMGSASGAANGEIVVRARTRVPGPDNGLAKAFDGTVVGLSPNEFLRLMAEAQTDPLMEKLDEIFGLNFFRKLAQTASGTLYGYTTAGPVGAVLGGIQGLVRDLGNGGKINASWAETISKSLGAGLEGAQTGMQVAAFGKMLGIKTSSTGGSIGGAIGAMSGIPGGDIIGSIAGSLIGGALKSAKRGTATVGAVNGAAEITGTRGNSSSRISAAKGLAGGALDALDQIINALDGELGTFSGSIGIRNKKFVVDPTGQGRTKGRGVQKFESEADAQAALLRDLIADGAVKGISAAVQKALGSSPDIERAMKEALAVQDVEQLLGGLTGQWAKAFREFEAQASERLRIARQYGFDVAALEARNAEDRLKLQEKLLTDQIGGLQDLITEMTSGSLFEGSAVDRRTAILAEIEKARAALGRGEEGAGDRLAQLFRDLNEVSKSIYGTTGGFAQDRSSILDQARAAIAETNARIQQARGGGGDPAVVSALDENNDQNAQIIAALADQNSLLAAIAGELTANTKNNNFDSIIDRVRTS